MIYLDYAATTPVPREVADTMYQVLTERFGNPSSQYRIGLEMKKQVEQWRKTVAEALDCPPERLYFTACGTEGDNWAITAAAWQNRRLGRHIVTTAVEHSAVIETCRWLEPQGYEVTYVKPDSRGTITAQQILEAVRPDTALVSVMLVNNELGAIYPISEIARGLAARNPQTLLHTDAVQGFLKVPCSAKALGADFITISGHKIGGPKGVGGPDFSPPGEESQAAAGRRRPGGRPALWHGGNRPDRRLCQGGGAQAGESPGQAAPYGGAEGLRRGASLRYSRPADHLRGGWRPSHSVRLSGGLAQSEYSQRSEPAGHFHLRRLRLPSGQAQSRGGGSGPTQAGGRRGDPPELRPGDHKGRHRRLCRRPPNPPRHPHADAVVRGTPRFPPEAPGSGFLRHCPAKG